MLGLSESRWKGVNLDLPTYSGFMPNIEKFDGKFFGFPRKVFECMDPQSRLLLEHAYEAVMDAGMNPKSLLGSNTGVFVTASLNESDREYVTAKYNLAADFTE
jgi:fatty acid synthase